MGVNAIDMRHSISQDGGVVYNERGNVVLGVGDTVPTDAKAGYEVGCLWIDTNGADGAVHYVNEGTATSCDFNPSLGGVLGRFVNVPDAATYTVLAADTCKTHILPNFTASCTLTLPAAAAGLEYRFIGKAVAADAQNWVFNTAAAAAFYLGGLVHIDTDAGAAGDEVADVYPNGSTNDVMTIVTPGAGTEIYLICDGTNWIVNGRAVSATAPTFGD